MNKLSPHTITYKPHLRNYLGSVLSCILFDQLEFEFQKNPDGFKKNLEKDDSWIKMLSFSVDEFRTAFDRIGVRYKSKSEFELKKGFEFTKTKNGQQYFYCSVIDRLNHTTHYYRNHMLLDDFFDHLENPETTEEFIGLKNNNIEKGRKI